LENILQVPRNLFSCRPIAIAQFAGHEFPGFRQERKDGLAAFLPFILVVIAFARSHLFAIKRVHRRVGVDCDRFQHDIACRPHSFPHEPLNGLDLLGDANVQRIKKTPERTLRQSPKYGQPVFQQSHLSLSASPAHANASTIYSRVTLGGLSLHLYLFGCSRMFFCSDISMQPFSILTGARPEQHSHYPPVNTIIIKFIHSQPIIDLQQSLGCCNSIGSALGSESMLSKRSINAL
jgi:hypothetical protein